MKESLTERLAKLIYSEVQYRPKKEFDSLKSRSRSRYRKAAGRTLVYLRKIRWKM